MKTQAIKINQNSVKGRAQTTGTSRSSHSAQDIPPINSFKSPKEIVILMMFHDVTQTQVANSLGVTVPAVNSVIKGLRKNPRIRKAIADAVRLPVSQIWPSEKPKNNNDKSLNQKHTKDRKSLQGKS